MNWFKRHINWSMGIGWLLSFPAALAGYLLFSCSIAVMLGMPYLRTMSGLVLSGAGYTVFIASIILVSLWGCRQKGQSGWWVLVALTGVGCIYLLCLENKFTKHSTNIFSKSDKEDQS